eukprot:jgi/Undpi1/5098/HiC_scaffold_19.g08450.m1
MLKLTRALRVVALSALMLGAVLQPSSSEDVVPVADAVSDARAALDAAADAVVEAEKAAQEGVQERGGPAAEDAAGVGADAPGVDVAAAPVAEAPMAEAPKAEAPKAAGPIAAAPKKELKAAVDNGGDAGGGAGDGLYFFVKNKGPMKCFVVSQGRGSVFHVHYDFPAAEKGASVMLDLRHLPLHGPRRKRLDQKPSLSKAISKRHGSHQFEIKTGGSYSLCATTDSSHGPRGLRIYLDLDTGKQDTVYEEVKKNYNLDDMQISMIQLKNQAKDLLREADFVKELETDYHKNVLQLNREVLWWPVSQVVMLLIMGFLQVRHLKKFFKNKRLV